MSWVHDGQPQVQIGFQAPKPPNGFLKCATCAKSQTTKNFAPRKRKRLEKLRFRGILNQKINLLKTKTLR